MFISYISQQSGIPESAIAAFWETGVDVSFTTMELISTPAKPAEKSFVIIEGVVREFYTDPKDREHTLRLIPPGSMISPSWTKLFINKPTKLSSQALTPITARQWTFDQTMTFAEENNRFFKLILAEILRTIREKNRNEIRRHQFTAKERYGAFLQEYPGMVNQIALKYVASYLKMTPETISRIRAELSQIKDT